MVLNIDGVLYLKVLDPEKVEYCILHYIVLDVFKHLGIIKILSFNNVARVYLFLFIYSNVPRWLVLLWFDACWSSFVRLIFSFECGFFTVYTQKIVCLSTFSTYLKRKLNYAFVMIYLLLYQVICAFVDILIGLTG